MPRIALVGDGHTSADYATLALWWSAESGVGYGDTIIALCKGFAGQEQTLTGSSTDNAEIYTDGVIYDGSNHADLALLHSLTLSTTSSVKVHDININTNKATKIPVAILSTALNAEVYNFYACRDFHHAGDYVLYNDSRSLTNKFENFVVNATGSSLGFYSRSSDYCTVKNGLFFGAIDYGMQPTSANATAENVFSFGNGVDFDIVTQTLCASEDLTSTSGRTGYTSVELVNFAGGDYRTKSTSDLADDGSGGFIGAFLESGGGGLTIDTPSITSAESFGSPSVILSTTYLLPTSMTSAESFGTHTVTSLDQFISVTSTSSSEAFGGTIILPGSVSLSPSAIASQESLGEPSMIYSLVFTPASIDSEEKFGVLFINDGLATVIPISDRYMYNKIAEYLKTQPKFLSVQSNDIIVEWLRSETGKEGTFNDLFMEYWKSKGYTGAYNDRWKKWRDE